MRILKICVFLCVLSVAKATSDKDIDLWWELIEKMNVIMPTYDFLAKQCERFGEDVSSMIKGFKKDGMPKKAIAVIDEKFEKFKKEVKKAVDKGPKGKTMRRIEKKFKEGLKLARKEMYDLYEMMQGMLEFGANVIWKLALLGEEDNVHRRSTRKVERTFDNFDELLTQSIPATANETAARKSAEAYRAFLGDWERIVGQLQRMDEHQRKANECFQRMKSRVRNLAKNKRFTETTASSIRHGTMDCVRHAKDQMRSSQNPGRSDSGMKDVDEVLAQFEHSMRKISEDKGKDEFKKKLEGMQKDAVEMLEDFDIVPSLIEHVDKWCEKADDNVKKGFEDIEKFAKNLVKFLESEWKNFKANIKKKKKKLKGKEGKEFNKMIIEDGQAEFEGLSSYLLSLYGSEQFQFGQQLAKLLKMIKAVNRVIKKD